MGGGGRGRVPGLAAYMRRPSPPSTFQNGSQGDFPTRGRAEPLKRNRIRLQPQLGLPGRRNPGQQQPGRNQENPEVAEGSV